MNSIIIIAMTITIACSGKKITRIAVGSGAVVASGCSDDRNGGGGDGVLRPRI